MCLCVCLVTGCWSEQPGAAHCGAIHGRRLQMNASIHNYSLSISRSPRRLVVVFSSSLQKKKQLKLDKNKLEHKQCTWKKKTKTAREGVCECVWGSDSSVGLHTTHYLCFMLEKILLDLLEHSRMNAISSKKLTQLLNVGYIFLIFPLCCKCACLTLSFLKGSDYFTSIESWGKPL